MKQYGLRHLYKHLGEELKSLPFEITNHNRVIAVVTKPVCSICKGSLLVEDFEGNLTDFPCVCQVAKRYEAERTQPK